MKTSIVGALSFVEIFENLTDTQLELIASICGPMTLNKGDMLVRENDSSDEMYVIVQGIIEIFVDPATVSFEEGLEPVLIAELRRGQVLGEVALVDQGMRSATARAGIDATQLLMVPREKLMLLCDTYPEMGYRIMKNLAADLALKIRNTDLTLRQYQSMMQSNQSQVE